MSEATSGPREPPQFHPNRELLCPGLLAPLPLSPNSRPLLIEALRAALRRAGSPAELVEPASITGGGLIHACQEIVLASNRLISGPREALAREIRLLLWGCRDLLGARDAAYVLKQASEGAGRGPDGGAADLDKSLSRSSSVGPRPSEEASGEEGRRGDMAESIVEEARRSITPPQPAEARRGFGIGSKLKNLMEPMERRFHELGLPVHMDPVRFAILQVHLDEIYDLAARELERFYRAIAEADPGVFRAFARGLASSVTREIVPDHVLAVDAGPGRERTGLLDLLPELEREFG